jgi:hypothetical protein
LGQIIHVINPFYDLETTARNAGKIRREKRAMNKKVFAAAFAFLFLAIGYTPLEAAEVQEGIAGKAVPVIAQSFASTEICTGEAWKVYLNASDPNGEMKKLFALADQPGVGQCPLSITGIEKKNRKELSGYLYPFTATSFDPLDFVNLKPTVYVQDGAGNFSQPAVFPLSIQSSFSQAAPAAGLFQEPSLGPIMVKLKRVRGGGGKGKG